MNPTLKMVRTFRKGGIHPSENKLSAAAAIERLPLPETVVVPLLQGLGAPAVPVVEKGDKVLVGQLIARADGFVSANLHAPVSGTVTAVDMAVNASGVKQQAIFIAREGDEWAPAIDRSEKFVKGCPLSAEDIVRKIADAGIVGMGGAAFPTHVKLSVPAGKKAEYLLINGSECEPYLTADDRLMVEKTKEVLAGAAIIAKALGVEKTFVGVENNKPEAIEALTRAAQDFLSMEIVPLKSQYPQGGEKMLIEAILGRRVPSGALPIDVGAVVQNIGTAFAVYEAVQKNKPLIDRVVTVTGRNLARPSNFSVRLGTPTSSLIEAAGGMPAGAGKVVGGGPMMGRAMSNIDAPVTKGTSGVLVMCGAEALRPAETACIRCGGCVAVCPMGLEPHLLARMSRQGMWERVEQTHATDCGECGSCAYACPARIPLLDWMRIGKKEAMKIKRK